MPSCRLCGSEVWELIKHLTLSWIMFLPKRTMQKVVRQRETLVFIITHENFSGGITGQRKVNA